MLGLAEMAKGVRPLGRVLRLSPNSSWRRRDSMPSIAV